MRISDWSSDVCSSDLASHDLPLLLRVTRPDDHLVGLLVVTGARALGRLAPRGDRVTAARGTAFAAAMRVVDRVLRDAAGERTLAEPAIANRLRSEEHTSELQTPMRKSYAVFCFTKKIE